MTTQTTQMRMTVKVISTQYEKPYVSITEEDAVRLEEVGALVKRVVSERFGPSCQVALKIAPTFMRMEGCIDPADLQVGKSYEVFIKPYRFVYNGKSGISLQSNFMRVVD